MMKECRQKMESRFPQFLAGAVTAVMVTALAGTALAAGGQIDFNKVGIRVLQRQQVEAGEMYTAPNGQQVPSSITYTDAAGGKTNYLSVRQISELLDADISWNGSFNSVDVGVPSDYGNVTVQSGTTAKENRTQGAVQYGLKIGALEEVNPSTVPGWGDPQAMAMKQYYTRDTRIQYGFGSSFPEMTVTADPNGSAYLVYSVTNNGTTPQNVMVSRNVTVSMGRRELFPMVSVEPGQTLVRAFRIDKAADPMKRSFSFGISGTADRDSSTDLTVTLGYF